MQNLSGTLFGSEIAYLEYDFIRRYTESELEYFTK